MEIAEEGTSEFTIDAAACSSISRYTGNREAASGRFRSRRSWERLLKEGRACPGRPAFFAASTQGLCCEYAVLASDTSEPAPKMVGGAILRIKASGIRVGNGQCGS